MTILRTGLFSNEAFYVFKTLEKALYHYDSYSRRSNLVRSTAKYLLENLSQDPCNEIIMTDQYKTHSSSFIKKIWTYLAIKFRDFINEGYFGGDAQNKFTNTSQGTCELENDDGDCIGVITVSQLYYIYTLMKSGFAADKTYRQFKAEDIDKIRGMALDPVTSSMISSLEDRIKELNRVCGETTAALYGEKNQRVTQLDKEYEAKIKAVRAENSLKCEEINSQIASIRASMAA